MSKISNDKILEVFLEISKGTASKRKLESITGVSRKRIAAFMSMLSSKGYKPNDVLNFTEEELNLVFERNCHRKEFIEPDFVIMCNSSHICSYCNCLFKILYSGE